MARRSGGRRGGPTIGQAAAAIGVSKATVSRALNGRGRIAPETRRRVLDALASMGYVPSRTARNLSTGRTHLVGLSIGQTRDPTAVAVVEGALAAALPAGYAVAVYLTGPHREAELYADLAARDGIDGLLALYPTEADAEPLRRLAAHGLPVVLIEPQRPIPPLAEVCPDLHHDGLTCTRHLLELGHRRIAVCADASGWADEAELVAGYRAALAAAGVESDPALVRHQGWTFEDGYRATRVWLAQPEPPTGLLFCCDTAALGGIAAVRACGLRVPDDVSIVGFDDTALAQWVVPRLTTPAERRLGLVRTACEHLLALIRGAALPGGERLVRTRLVVRESTGPAPVRARRAARRSGPSRGP